MFEIVDIAEGRFGKKMYATVPLVKDTFIVRFTGEMIDYNRAVHLGDRESFALQVSPDAYIYLDRPARYFNHSCDPNCGVRPDLYLVALREIAKGEELTFDYSTTMLERKWTMDCQCGKPICRKVVKDFDLLPAERQRYYLSRGVVQEFIVKAISSRNARQRATG